MYFFFNEEVRDRNLSHNRTSIKSDILFSVNHVNILNGRQSNFSKAYNYIPTSMYMNDVLMLQRNLIYTFNNTGFA